MINLLEETIEVLREVGHTPNEVLWVGNTEVKTTWDNFAKLANENYHDGYGDIEVPLDLLIVGDGWWLERYEYDGMEGWSYKSQPIEPEKKVTLKRIFNDFYNDSLTENYHY